MRNIIKLLLLPVISITLFYYTLSSNISPKLGLDLQGGISVILTAPEGTEQELIEQAVEIMRTRIEAFGDVQEPEISISGNNSVLVQLPGVTDQNKAIEALGTTGLLTFRPVLDSSLTNGFSPAFDYQPNPDDPENPIKIVPDGVDEIIGISNEDNPSSISYLLGVNTGFPVIYELGPAALTGNDISGAIAVYPDNEWIVSLELKSESDTKFTNLTKELASKTGEQRKLAIVLDGEVVSAPGIAYDVDPNVGITGGNAAISMVNKAKKQGTNYETNIVNRLNKVENFKSQRFAEGGSKDLGDIQLFADNEEYFIEAKSRQNLNLHQSLEKAIEKSNNVNTVLFWKKLKRKGANKRRTNDGMPEVVSMSYDLFIKLLNK